MAKRHSTRDPKTFTIYLTEEDAELIWRLVLAQSPPPENLEHAFVACAERITDLQTKLRDDKLEGKPVRDGAGWTPWKVSLHF